MVSQKSIPILDSGVLTSETAVFIFTPITCALIIWFCLPETNGLSLEEIEQIFDREQIDAVAVVQIVKGDEITVVKDQIMSKSHV